MELPTSAVNASVRHQMDGIQRNSRSRDRSNTGSNRSKSRDRRQMDWIQRNLRYRDRNNTSGNRSKSQDHGQMDGIKKNSRSRDRSKTGSNRSNSRDGFWMVGRRGDVPSTDRHRSGDKSLTREENGRKSNRSRSKYYKATNLLPRALTPDEDQDILIMPWIYQYNFKKERENNNLLSVTAMNIEEQHLTINPQITSLNRPPYYTTTLQQTVTNETPEQSWKITSSLSMSVEAAATTAEYMVTSADTAQNLVPSTAMAQDVISSVATAEYAAPSAATATVVYEESGGYSTEHASEMKIRTESTMELMLVFQSFDE